MRPGILPGEVHTPHTSKEWLVVVIVVPHAMVGLIRVHQLLDRRDLSVTEQAINVPGQHAVHLAVNAWKESPDHGEQLDRINPLQLIREAQTPDRADVQDVPVELVIAAEVTELLDHMMTLIQIHIESHDSSWIELGHGTNVPNYAIEVSVANGAIIPENSVKVEGDHFLARASGVGLGTAGGV